MILDQYRATVIRFLDAGRMPEVVVPGTQLTTTHRATRVLALSRDELSQSLDAATAQRAIPIARDPRGNPILWAVER